MSSEQFHPYAPDRVIVARDSFIWSVQDFDALYQHLESVITDIVCGDTDAAALKVKLLMCAATIAGERRNPA